MQNLDRNRLKHLLASVCLVASFAASPIVGPYGLEAQAQTTAKPSVNALIDAVKTGSESERKDALNQLEILAISGNEEASAALGNIYSDGKSVPKDLSKALSVYSEAYAKGNLKIAGKLGNLYYRNFAELSLDQAKALEFFQKGADSGDAWAMASLADVYREGKIVPQDLAKSLALYNQALEKGNSSVIGKIGNLYYRNFAELGLDQAKALEFFQKGSDGGDAWAMGSLADVYREGKIVPQDLPKALALYNEALEKGNTSVVGKLGDLHYRNAAALNVDPAKAVSYYQQGSDAGDAWAMASLADVYRDGKIVPKDLKKAFDLYNEALEKGNSSVVGKLGDFYYRNWEVLDLDQAKAVSFYEQGAEAGDAWAMASLADVYRDGKVVPQDLGKALKLYEEALAKGNTSVISKIGNLYYRNATDLGVDQAKAIDFYQKGADSGDAWAIASLADVYREGKIVPADLQKAFDLYSDALAKGNTSVVGKLGNLYYRNGEDLKLDPAKALDYFRQGADAGDAWAVASLADVYREGKIVPADMAKASELYQKSYKGGNEGAYVAEAAMLLRGTRAQQKRGLSMIKTGLKGDMPGIVPVWAEANLFGRGMPRNPQKALNILKQATAKGDVNATFRLAALYIQGYGNAIPRSQRAAKRLLAGLEGKAEKDRIASEMLYMQGAFAASQSELKSFADELKKLSPSVQASMVSRISWANQNTYVYMLQDHLKGKGLYKGRLNGQLTGSTISAFSNVCREIAEDKQVCGNGPLSEQVRILLSDYMKQV